MSLQLQEVEQGWFPPTFLARRQSHRLPSALPTTRCAPCGIEHLGMSILWHGLPPRSLVAPVRVHSACTCQLAPGVIRVALR
eukprot:117488-Amphidinium_carterae.1